jgi:hypothetical protein
MEGLPSHTQVSLLTDSQDVSAQIGNYYMILTFLNKNS